MTNEQLVAQIKAGENVGENMEQLYSQVRRFIHVVASRYRGSGELEDLEQEGFLALYDAVEGYDPDQGTQFLTYAEYWIKQRIQRYLQQSGSCLRLSVYCQEKNRRYKRLCSSYQAEYGREPSEDEIARFMGLTVEQVRNVREDACMARLGSLDAPVKGLDGGEEATVGDLTPAPGDLEEDVVERMQREQLCAVLWECVDSLEEVQAETIRKRYQRGMSLREIGAEQGISPEVVRREHNKALRELRKPRCAKRLRPFVPEEEWIFSMSISGTGVGRFRRTWTSSTERAALWLDEQEERRREHLELLENVARSQQEGTVQRN